MNLHFGSTTETTIFYNSEMPVNTLEFLQIQVENIEMLRTWLSKGNPHIKNHVIQTKNHRCKDSVLDVFRRFLRDIFLKT